MLIDDLQEQNEGKFDFINEENFRLYSLEGEELGLERKL